MATVKPTPPNPENLANIFGELYTTWAIDSDDRSIPAALKRLFGRSRAFWMDPVLRRFRWTLLTGLNMPRDPDHPLDPAIRLPGVHAALQARADMRYVPERTKLVHTADEVNFLSLSPVELALEASLVHQLRCYNVQNTPSSQLDLGIHHTGTRYRLAPNAVDVNHFESEALIGDNRLLPQRLMYFVVTTAAHTPAIMEA
ncbi:uncharacterized protein K452DRAFT_296922 [Aplosporella prunicola CBS 121167]|uniref:Uncharacterized protein n=1 Tax=Aplosporella prunicola CBS 121167 TaxID=1176127 RepID=A0A6A6BG49_9PEZI|nr:uncharacterized protein K452DRAFT_296922 [Aplosporella prunicola CBS 121167]KAF2143132.1 hypothetical protein K452DRAFT_296922 [Aplosporella prunicola CBS 121167]